MSVEQLFSSLLTHLETLAPEPDRMQMLRTIQLWLQRFATKWSPDLRERWGLEEYATLDLNHFPVAESSLLPQEELGQLRAVRPTSMDTFAMRLRDILWEGITVESSVLCPRCDAAQLRVLEDPASREVVLACDLCGWAQTGNGAIWSGHKRLRPASKELLDHWRTQQSRAKA